MKIGYKNTLNSQQPTSPLTAKDKTLAGKVLNFYTLGVSGAVGDAIKKRKAEKEEDPVRKIRREARTERRELRQTNRDEKKSSKRTAKATKVKARLDKRTAKLKARIAKKS